MSEQRQNNLLNPQGMHTKRPAEDTIGAGVVLRGPELWTSAAKAWLRVSTHEEHISGFNAKFTDEASDIDTLGALLIY
jgi:hypothetical protein